MNPIKKFFDISTLLPKTGALGEVPTTGRAYRDVIDIAIPSVAEMVLMSLIGSVDTMMVGNTLGSSAIAAVGLVGQPRMLLLCIFFAMNIGVTAIVARRKGEGRREDANRTLRNALVMIVGIALVLMALGLTFSKPLMRFAGAQDDTVDMANVYFRILAYALPINALSMCICAAQRGVGNTRITMYVNITSNLVNVVFNYLLIGGNLGFPRMEVAGAALASVIGMFVGFLLSVVTLIWTKKENDFLKLQKGDSWRLDGETLRSITTLGGNAMLEQVALRIGFFTYAKIVAGLGTQAFAAHQICMQFLNLSFTFGDGIGVAGTSLVGQMLGKRRPDLSQVYGKAAQRMALVVSLGIATCMVLFRHPLVSLFANDSEVEVLNLAAKVMFMVALFQPFQTTSVVISGALRGAGDTRFVALVMMVCVAVIRPVATLLAVWILRDLFGAIDIALIGAWAASLIDMVTRMCLVYKRFNGGKWHDIRV